MFDGRAMDKVIAANGALAVLVRDWSCDGFVARVVSGVPPSPAPCHVTQAVGSLKAFAAGGTAAYREVMGWSDTVSASPLSAGALTCLFRPTYLSTLLATVTLPVLASVAVIAVFLAATALRHIRLPRRRRGSDNGDGASDGRCGCDTGGLRVAVAEWWAERRHAAALLFVAFVTYMSIITSALRALDCTQPIDGVRYLRVDLSVACGAGQHTAASIVAYVVLVCEIGRAHV